MKPLKRERQKKSHKLPLSRHFLKFKMSCLVKFSHKLSPLFNRFSTFDKNVNLLKANPEAENFFLVFPSLNTSIFTTYLKIARTLRPFEKLDSKMSILKMEKFSNFFHNGKQIFLPNKSREKDNLIKTYSNLLKIRFQKWTHVFDNTMIFFKETFQKIPQQWLKHKKSHHKTKNSWSHVTIRELQARKHNQISAITRLLRKTKIQKKTNISWYQSWDTWVFLKQKFVSKLLNLWKQPKGHKISKIVKKEVTGH